jgi:hypothetical protein
MSNIFIGSYPQITEVGGDDLLPVIQGGELKNATKNNVLGYRSFIAKFKQDDEDAITQTTFLNTTGTASPSIYYVSGVGAYFEVEFTGEFNVHIDNMNTFAESKNTLIPIYGSLGSEASSLIGHFSVSFYLDGGNTYVYWYFFDATGETSGSYYDLMGQDNEYFLPEIKLFDIPA